MACLLPMIAALKRAFGIDENIGDLLDIAHFQGRAPDLQQRVVGSAGWVGGVEQQHATELCPPSCGQGPILALYVMDDGRTRPGQKRRDNKANALAAARGCEAQHMFRAIMAKIMPTPAAQHYSVRAEQPGATNLRGICPARRTVGRD